MQVGQIKNKISIEENLLIQKLEATIITDIAWTEAKAIGTSRKLFLICKTTGRTGKLYFFRFLIIGRVTEVWYWQLDCWNYVRYNLQEIILIIILLSNNNRTIK